MALNESIQPEREIHKASTSSKIDYGQLPAHPNDIRKYNSSHRWDSRNHGRRRSQRYKDPNRYIQGYQRDRSRSTSWFQRYESRNHNRFRNTSCNRHDRVRSPKIFALEIHVHLRVRNIHVPAHPYTNLHVLNVAVHSIDLQIYAVNCSIDLQI